MDFQLASGERLLWRGAPVPGIRFQAYDLLLIPFGIVWLIGVLLVFGVLAFSGGQVEAEADPMAYIFLPIFLLFGLYFTFGRLFTDMMARGRTEYVLTSRRAIIEGGFWRKSSRSVNLAATAEIRFHEGRGGRGTIEFGSGPGFPFVPRGWPGAGQFMPPAFDRVEGARHVYELALEAQRESQQLRAT